MTEIARDFDGQNPAFGQAKRFILTNMLTVIRFRKRSIKKETPKLKNKHPNSPFRKLKDCYRFKNLRKDKLYEMKVKGAELK